MTKNIHKKASCFREKTIEDEGDLDIIDRFKNIQGDDPRVDKGEFHGSINDHQIDCFWEGKGEIKYGNIDGIKLDQEELNVIFDQYFDARGYSEEGVRRVIKEYKDDENKLIEKIKNEMLVENEKNNNVGEKEKALREMGFVK